MGQMVIAAAGELTERGQAIVEWIGRGRAVTIKQVARRFRLSRTRAYVCVGRCVAMGLWSGGECCTELRRSSLRAAQDSPAPGCLLPTRRISPALARHHQACGSVAVRLAELATPVRFSATGSCGMRSAPSAPDRKRQGRGASKRRAAAGRAGLRRHRRARSSLGSRADPEGARAACRIAEGEDSNPRAA